jgi:hypothetical protein
MIGFLSDSVPKSPISSVIITHWIDFDPQLRATSNEGPRSVTCRETTSLYPPPRGRACEGPYALAYATAASVSIA